MAYPLWQQLQALRAPPELKSFHSNELDHHISHNILPFLRNMPTKLPNGSDDESSNDILKLLSPATDTLPYLHILDAQLKKLVDTSKEQVVPQDLDINGIFWQNYLSFLSDFDPIEIRYAGSKWRDLMSAFDLVTQSGKADSIMEHMAKAMLRMDPSLGTYTSTHLLFVQLCLRTGSLNVARQILDHDWHSLPDQDCPTGTSPCSTHFTSNSFITIHSKLSGRIVLSDILEYHLSGAIVYIGLQEWEHAAYQLEIVMSTPTSNVAHGLMLEAYKKWLLVGLIKVGQGSAIPKTTNSAALKTMKLSTRPYESIVEAFKQEDSRKLHAEAYEGRSVWFDDGNDGLIQNVLNRHKEFSVVRLEKVYAVIPLDLLTGKLNMSTEQTQAYVESLIKNGHLHAKLEQLPGHQGKAVLKFLQGSAHIVLNVSEDQLRSELMKQNSKITSLSHDVGESDRRLAKSKEYLDHIRRSRKATGQDRSSPEQEGMDVPLAHGAVSDEEESVMEDVG